MRTVRSLAALLGLGLCACSGRTATAGSPALPDAGTVQMPRFVDSLVLRTKQPSPAESVLIARCPPPVRRGTENLEVRRAAARRGAREAPALILRLEVADTEGSRPVGAAWLELAAAANGETGPMTEGGTDSSGVVMLSVHRSGLYSLTARAIGFRRFRDTLRVRTEYRDTAIVNLRTAIFSECW